MKKQLVKHTILILLSFGLVVFLIMAILPAVRNYNGYCAKEGRYLSDEERINIEVSTIIEHQSQAPWDTIEIQDNEQKTHYYKRLKYASVQELKEKNPDCCKVDPGGPYELSEPTFLNRITGYNSGKVIEVKYLVRYLDQTNVERSKLVTSQSFQTNCGEYSEY